MIKANELRLGNLVYPFDDYRLLKEKTILRDCIKVNYKDLKYTSKLFPIPLTEEILLKCGFNKGIDGSFIKNDISVFLDKRFKTNLYLQTNELSLNHNWFGYECKVKHLHQLQNLYFALTGEELKIEL